MCEKAEEIQDEHKNNWRKGDHCQCGMLIADHLADCTPLDNWLTLADNSWIRMECATWLPRQDELYEILRKSNKMWISKSIHLMQEFAVFVNRYFDPDFLLDQFWLAFVMWTLFHKKWYNGEWRLEDDRGKANSEVTS